ncbi:MAG: ribosome biogenesis GTPase Der [Candidatus Poribacteria bacterium]|nr:ribosome biogenesis GTPase Der [Candidatus Poribacteria bacterium]
MAEPIVAIVGRPNVGKSSLFNRILGRRIAVVDDIPGVTRDRLYAPVEWRDKRFRIVDTGGLVPDPDDSMIEQVKFQVGIAVREASLIWYVVDLIDGLSPDDHAVADMLRASGKRVFVVGNKADDMKIEMNLAEMYQLGFDDNLPVSAIHKNGIEPLLDRTVEVLPEQSDDDDEPSQTPIQVAVVGRPNAGKSSIINALIGETRMIVDDVPGTTRDSINVLFEKDAMRFELIDTAGMRRRNRIEKRSVEEHSVLRSTRSVQKADVTWLVLDISREISHQDQTIGAFAARHGKICIVVANKWDLIEKDNHTFNEYTQEIQDVFSAYDYLPIVFTSAVKGQRVENLLELTQRLFTVGSTRVATPILNDWLRGTTHEMPPPVVKSRRPSLKYITQVDILPPTFVIFTTMPDYIPEGYQRFLTNRLREAFDFEGVPIQLIFRDTHAERES